MASKLGEQGQVDWAHFGTLKIGRALRKLLAFVLVRFFLDARGQGAAPWVSELIALEETERRRHSHQYRISNAKLGTFKADGRLRLEAPQRRGQDHARPEPHLPGRLPRIPGSPRSTRHFGSTRPTRCTSSGRCATGGS